MKQKLKEMWLKSHLQHPVIFLDSEIINLEAVAKIIEKSHEKNLKII